MYAVLRPVVHRTNQQTPWSVPAEPSYWHRTEWLRIGTARDMEHAKQQFGGSPVLEEIKD
jgi:hypothetical protein